jgi:hypothetical protein
MKPRSELIFDHAVRFVNPFSTTLGHPWVIVPDGITRSYGWPIFSSRFRQWLAHSFNHEHGIFAGGHAIDGALNMLAAHARYSQFPRGEIFTRVGWRGDRRRPHSVLLHLANANNELLEITADSHHIIDCWRFPASGTPGLPASQPWHFLSGDTTIPIPHPVTSTTPLLDQLHEILGISGPALTRILVWLFAALRPTGPYPVLALTGPVAAGKTMLARILRALIDPSRMPVSGAPANEHDLFADALHNHVLVYGHIDKFHPYVAGAIARLAKGTGFAVHRRNIYDEPESFALARPIIVTAPEVPAAFAGNSMRVHLDGIRPHHRNEYDIGCDIETAAPSIVGSLCAAVSCALRNMASTDARSPSRFADVHHWTMAAAPALGLTPDQINHALAASPLTDAVANLLEGKKEWTGTATDLLAALDKVGYPRMASTPRALATTDHHPSGHVRHPHGERAHQRGAPNSSNADPRNLRY